MASAQGIKAGQAYIQLGLSGLGKVKDTLGRLGAMFTKVFKIAAAGAAAAATAALASIRTFAKMGDEMQKAALRAGTSVENLSELKHAAEEADVSLEDLGAGIFRAQRERPGATFEELADEVKNAGDEAAQAAKAYEIFGRRGETLLPLLKQGSKGIAAQREEARKLGLVMSQESADAAAALSDEMAAIGKQIKMVIFEVGRWLVENTNLIDSLKAISEWLGTLINLIKRNELGDAWSFMWTTMELAYNNFLKSLAGSFLEKWLNTVRGLLFDLLNAYERFSTFIGASPMDTQWIRELKEIYKDPIDLSEDLDANISALEERLRKLQARAQRGARARRGAGSSAVSRAGAAGFGTFDPAAAIRYAIGQGGGLPNIEKQQLEQQKLIADQTQLMVREMRKWNRERYRLGGWK